MCFQHSSIQKHQSHFLWYQTFSISNGQTPQMDSKPTHKTDSKPTLKGQPFRFWGLGQGKLGFRGGTWRQPCRFWSYHLAVVMGRWSAGQVQGTSSSPTHPTPSVAEHLACVQVPRTSSSPKNNPRVRTETHGSGTSREPPGSGTRQFWGSGPSPFPFRMYIHFSVFS